MAHGGDKRVRADHDMMADDHRRNIKNGHVVIGEKSVTNMNVGSVVAPEWLLHRETRSGRAEELPQNAGLPLDVGGIGVIEPPARHHRRLLARHDLRIQEAVDVSGLQLLELCAPVLIVHAMASVPSLPRSVHRPVDRLALLPAGAAATRRRRGRVLRHYRRQRSPMKPRFKYAGPSRRAS